MIVFLWNMLHVMMLYKYDPVHTCIMIGRARIRIMVIFWVCGINNYDAYNLQHCSVYSSICTCTHAHMHCSSLTKRKEKKKHFLPARDFVEFIPSWQRYHRIAYGAMVRGYYWICYTFFAFFLFVLRKLFCCFSLSYFAS